MSGGGSRAAALLLLALYAAAPAAALDVNRAEVRAFIDEVSERSGLERDWVSRILAAAETRSAVIDAMNRPAERVLPWFEYRRVFVSERRIRDGREFYALHRPLLEEVAKRSGVPGEIIAAIVGVESSYGRVSGQFRALDALATLAFDYPARASYFRGELEQFLLLAKSAGFDPLTVSSSYAGALGAPQFMPRAYREYARDGDGDGRIDLWNDWSDIFASVAHYFIAYGWRPGEPISAEAELWDPDVEGLPAGRLEPTQTLAGLRAKGVVFAAAVPDDGSGVFIALRGADAPLYRVGFHNFGVITRYNHSAMYALAVSELAAAIAAPAPGTPTAPSG